MMMFINTVKFETFTKPDGTEYQRRRVITLNDIDPTFSVEEIKQKIKQTVDQHQTKKKDTSKK